MLQAETLMKGSKAKWATNGDTVYLFSIIRKKFITTQNVIPEENIVGAQDQILVLKRLLNTCIIHYLAPAHHQPIIYYQCHKCRGISRHKSYHHNTASVQSQEKSSSYFNKSITRT